MKSKLASTLRKVPQTVMLILIPKKFLPISKRKISKATEIWGKNYKINHESLKFDFISIHLVCEFYNLIHTHKQYTNALFGLSNHQGETNGLLFFNCFFVGRGESKQTHYYVFSPTAVLLTLINY